MGKLKLQNILVGSLEEKGLLRNAEVYMAE
jgi:hypothetical protein